jgi:hypothetical protein
VSATTPPASASGIEVTGTHNPLQIFLYLVGLTVEIDGTAHRGPWREARSYPVSPGEHTVRVSFPYLGRARGGAETTVQVPTDGLVRLRYRAPQVVTGSGKLTPADS